jgi:lysozyme
MKTRIAVSALTFSAASLIGLALNEGYTDKAIIPTKGDVPTVGFGTTTRPDGSPVQLGDKTTPVEALQRKAKDLQKFEGGIKQCVNVPLSQDEYDVYVDFAYNIGTGKEGVKDGFCWSKRGGYSTLVGRLNAGDYRGACDAILLWKRVGGQDCSIKGNRICWGVWQRRLAAHQKCLGAQ